MDMAVIIQAGTVASLDHQIRQVRDTEDAQPCKLILNISNYATLAARTNLAILCGAYHHDLPRVPSRF